MARARRPRRAARACLPAVLLAIFALTAPAGGPRAAPGPAVDLALVLALDVSVSVDRTEFALQREGLAAAFRHRDVHEAISRGELGRIAVAVLLWSGPNQQVRAVPWVRIDGIAAALALARRLETVGPPALPGATAIGDALLAGARELRRVPFATDRRVIDLSGDGRSNAGPLPESVRGVLFRDRIVVNGLAIEHDDDWLGTYYRRHVVFGPGAFVERASGYGDFRRAILRKLLREIGLPQVTRRPAAPERTAAAVQASSPLAVSAASMAWRSIPRGSSASAGSGPNRRVGNVSEPTAGQSVPPAAGSPSRASAVQASCSARVTASAPGAGPTRASSAGAARLVPNSSGSSIVCTAP